MKFVFLSLFPELIRPFFESSILGKSVEKGLIEYHLIDIRDFSLSKHHRCDDEPYGGGAGMVLSAEPIARAFDSLQRHQNTVCIYPSPSGKKFCQEDAMDLLRYDEIIFLCGRYEGLDQRIIDCYVDKEVSLGDYVMSSGELSALVIADSVYRLCPGVIAAESLDEESFVDGLLEYPHYTRPVDFRGLRVPDVLISGHHADISAWRQAQRLERTRLRRPDLYEHYLLRREEGEKA